MGTKGRGIVGLDVEELITLLRKAFSDEWLAYYQYWIGAKVVRGPNKEAGNSRLTSMPQKSSPMPSSLPTGSSSSAGSRSRNPRNGTP